MIGHMSFFSYEKQAIDEITRHLESKATYPYRVLSNLLLHDPQTNHYYEYDVVIISPSRVYVVELKHWSGRIVIKPYNWRVDGRNYRRDPHPLNIYKCKVLKALYQHRFPTYPNIWVESVVVLTHPEAVVEGADSPKEAADGEGSNHTFSALSDFISYVNRQSGKHVKVLDDYQVDAVADYLWGLSKPKESVPDTILGYEIVDNLSATPERVELLGRHSDGQLGGLKRFRIFRAPAGSKPQDEERFLRQTYNAIKSVSKIGDHPNILQVHVLQDKTTGVVEMSDWSEVGTLRDYLKDQQPDKDTALGICQGILRGLCRAHEAGVIHRAVKPENILIVNDRPKLMNFGLAYVMEDNRLTVIEDPAALADDGYTAPEILLGEDIDESTDYFGFAVTAYELFTGERPFKTAQEYVARGGRLSAGAIERLKGAGLSRRLVDVVARMLVGDRKWREKDIGAILKVFDFHEPDRDNGCDMSDGVFAPGSTHDVYEVERLIAEGAEAHVYRGKTLNNRTVALKVYKRDVPRERSLQEWSITSTISSSYVIRSEYFGHWRNERYFLVMDYIDGESMRKKIERGEKPTYEEFRSVALSLMSAVAAFHHHKDETGEAMPLLHCDIKPDNIIIASDNKPVLIDCTLSGEPRIDVFQGTRDYVPPDSILGSDVQLSTSSDLYALGVTLWEWLFGQKPYDRASVGDKPNLPKAFQELPESPRAWLLRAVATEAEHRFQDLDDMQASFIKSHTSQDTQQQTPGPSQETARRAGIVIHERVEPGEQLTQDVYVAYLNTLANSSAANENATAEHQVLSSHFEKIHVPNPVTDMVSYKLLKERKNVVLTGNAGDGKTTIAIEIFRTVTAEERFLEPIERIPSERLVIVKDMSELSREQQETVISEALGNDDFVYLIVSNTGTFLDSFGRVFKGENVDSDLLNALKADTPQSLFGDTFYLINLGRIDSIKTACRVLRRMVAENHWRACSNCEHPDRCPVYFNVQLILEREDIFFERLELLYRRLFEYGTRLTMRHMTGHLAYALTGGYDCHAIKAQSLIGLEEHVSKSLFFNRFFGDDGSTPVAQAQQLYAVRRIREIGLGNVLDAKFERLAWLKRPITKQEEADSYHERVQRLITSRNNPVNRRQMRRYAFFFEPLGDDRDRDRFTSTFLRSDMLTRYLEYCSKNQGLPAKDENLYRRQIVQVLQEFFTGSRFPEGSYRDNVLYITLNRETFASRTQLVLADFRVDDFRLEVKPKYLIGDSFSGVLCLKHLSGDAVLELDLPFFDYVARRYMGEVTEELSAFYADRLERFKVQLLKVYEQDRPHDSERKLKLLVVDKGRKIDLKQLLIDRGRLEVL
ncbi:MAG: protein kinase domain-containing protein [Limnochordia bacterium]|jgi:serine/threonine protein kinase